MDKKILINILYTKYSSMLLSRKQVAEILGVSISTIDRMKNNGYGIDYIKVGKSKNASVKYPLLNIVEYICSNNIKVNR